MFSRVGHEHGVYPPVRWGCLSKLGFVQRSQQTCLGTMDTSGISTRLGRKLQMLLEVKQEIDLLF